ncbi:sodium neurotransmitter symporter (SNF) [Mactra antiquata]
MSANIGQHQDREHHLNVKDIRNTSPDTCDNEDQGRGNWSRKLDFILSCLSYVVGLGSIWRFPYICFRNGGGAFLILFFTILIVIGIPMVFLEMSFGQFASSGVVSIWKASPMFEACSNVRTDAIKSCTDNGGVFCNDKCFYQNEVSSSTWNNVTNCSIGNLISPSDDYFHMSVLGITKGIHDMGSIQWKLALCLLLAWVVICVCLAKGIKSSGKAVYFTSTFPYLVLGILLIRCLTLNGSVDGIVYFFEPQWHKLLEARVWSDAAIQVFYTLAPGLGGLITLASYNKFNNNCLVIIGYMAAELNQPISEVVQAGAGLAFIVYPDVVTKLPISQLWSVLFFTMLVTLGFGSQGGMYALQLFDNYGATFSLLVIVVIESIALSWVYGGDRFLTDIETMLGYRPRYFWVWCWRIIVPVALLSIKFLCKADVEWGHTKKINQNEFAGLSCEPIVDHPFSATHSYVTSNTFVDVKNGQEKGFTM